MNPPTVHVEQTGETTWWVHVLTNGTNQRRTRHRSYSAASKAASKLRHDLKVAEIKARAAEINKINADAQALARQVAKIIVENPYFF